MKENGIFVGVGDVNQAMKALVSSFTSHNFTYYAQGKVVIKINF